MYRRCRPSLTLTDPYFALAPGAEYTMEWAIYPGNTSCTDYFCFVNRVREDIGVNNLTLVGTGGLGQLSPRLMHEPMLTNAGYGMGKEADEHAKAWEDFGDEEFVRFLEHQSMHFVVNTIVSLAVTPFGSPRFAVRLTQIAFATSRSATTRPTARRRSAAATARASSTPSTSTRWRRCAC